MSMHKSLKSARFPKIRSVRKRYERIAKLQRNLQWLEKNQSVYGLPKEKIIRLIFKIKKEKEIKPLTPLYSPPVEEKRKKKISRDDKETKK